MVRLFLVLWVAMTTTPVHGQTPAPATVATTTSAPSPTTGAATTSPTVTPDRCNICGFGNIITNATAIVRFIDHAFKERSLSCGDLQDLVNVEDTPFPISFCAELRNVAIGGGCGCTTPEGILLTTPPTLFPTPAVTTIEPTYPEGIIGLEPSGAPVIVTPTTPPGGKCFVCGAEGNSIGSPDGSFKFTADGADKDLGCQQAQDLLETGEAPAGWCELVQKAASEPCMCLDSSGSPVASGPTISPNDRDCWICGKTDGVANIIGDGGAVVDYIDHEDVLRKFPCKELARYAEDTIAVPQYYCENVIEQSLIPCRCTTPAGDLISDMLYPTFSPANGGKPATPHYAAGEDDEEGGDSPTPGGNSNNTDGTSGGGSSANTIWCHQSVIQAVVLVVSLMILL